MPRFARSGLVYPIRFVQSVRYLIIWLVFSLLKFGSAGLHTTSTGCELHISSLHPVEIVALHSLGALLDHAISVRQLAAEDIGKDLGIAMRMGREAAATIDAVLVEDSQTAEVLISWIVVICETECMICVQPAVVGVSSVLRPARDNFGVGESLGHGVLDGFDRAHRRICSWCRFDGLNWCRYRVEAC